MPWYLVHTKPRQEARAVENLERQGYRCLLPMLRGERLKNGRIVRTPEPLFPRYLFICLSGDLNWMPIRSTLGVTTLVRFGSEPARVPDPVVQAIEARDSADRESAGGRQALATGDPVWIAEGPFAGLSALYDKPLGEERAFVFIEMLGKVARLPVEVAALRVSQNPHHASHLGSIDRG